jgi:hypothetical protein
MRKKENDKKRKDELVKKSKEKKVVNYLTCPLLSSFFSIIFIIKLFE